MTVDLAQFHQSFFEESFETLDAMEAALLKLEIGVADHDRINTIFRGAHSMKGGAAMLGFDEVTSFTHTLETLLDELRSGRKQVSAPMLDTLLKSVDVLREMLRAVHGKQPLNSQRVADVQFDLEAMVAQKAPAPQAATPAPQSTDPAPQSTDPAPQSANVPVAPASAVASLQSAAGWTIGFKPLPHLLLQGNDPLAIFGALRELGRVDVVADLSAIPPVQQLDPQICYVAWTLKLQGDCPREHIEETFEWTTGDCELSIDPGLTSQKTPASALPLASTTIPTSTPTPTVATTPAPASTSASPSTSVADQGKVASAESGSIRVGIDKVDELINTVGELVITQAMLSELGRDLQGTDADLLRTGLAQLERNMRQLQESVMRVRMLPISVAFSRFPRMVHDLAQRLGKKIELKLSGEQTELDKTVLEKIADPLTHLVRNSIEHGIEAPDVRTANRKPPGGTISLNACHSGGNIAVEVSDDGAGLDDERIPAMDLVRQQVKELGGSVNVRSEPGRGSRVLITLPLTLSIVDGQSVLVGRECYIVPLTSIVESLHVNPQSVSNLSGSGELFSFRGDYLPLLRLHELFEIEPRSRELHDGLVVIAEGDGRRVGLFVDELLGQQQVVIKSMESNYGHIEGISGATILGDGSVALILDVSGLIRAASLRAAA